MSSQTLPRETLAQWTGVNLRQDGLSMADQDVLRAIDADFHTQVGTILPRKGRVVMDGSSTLGSPIRTLVRHLGRRYQVAGSALYRNWTPILVGLSADPATATTVVPYRPLNDDTTWSFIADPALTPLMRKDSGSLVLNWGIAAPLAAPVLSAGASTPNLNGTYAAIYTYARVTGGGKLASESNPSASPGGIPLSAQALNVAVVASTDPQVTHIRIYRTLQGGSQFFFDQQVSNTTQTVSSTQVDGNLGTGVQYDNDPPVPATWVTEFQGHLFLLGDPANPDYLWYSKHFLPESFPAAQYLKIGDPADPLRSALAMTGVLGVFTRLTKYRIMGNSVSGFAALEALNTRGIVAPQACLASSRGALFVARDGLFLTNFVEQDQEISQMLQPLFYGQTVNTYAPIDWTYPYYLSLAEYKRRLYFGYVDTNHTQMIAVYSLDTGHWYHYQQAAYRMLYEEDLDQLTMSTIGGQTFVMETGTQDAGAAITAQVYFPPRASGDRFHRKGYKWLGLDSMGSWSVGAFVDAQPVASGFLAGIGRVKRYMRLPAQTAGQQWQGLASSSDANAALYAMDMLFETHAPGEVAVEDAANPGWFLQVIPGSPVGMPLPKRRFTFLVVDADAQATATATGLWQADLYIDDVLQTTIDIPAPHNKYLHALPVQLTGYEHYLRVRYNLTPVPLLYALEVLDTGLPDGQVWIRAPLSADAYVTVLPAAQPTEAVRRKRYGYMRLDAEAGPGYWTLELYVDMVLRYRVQVMGDRNRDLIRLPAQIQGYTWHVRAAYSLAAIPTLFGVEVLTMALQPV